MSYVDSKDKLGDINNSEFEKEKLRVYCLSFLKSLTKY